MVDSRYAGKVALVTGASSGIGEAIAVALAEAGTNVVVTGRRLDRLNSLVRRIQEAGGEAVAVSGDIASPADAQRIVDTAVLWKDRLDILVNNAGLSKSGTGIGEASLEDIRTVLDTNLFGLINATRLAIPALRKTKGDIINMSSVAAKMALPNSAVYGATKSAIGTFSESLRKELAQDRVRVSTVYPGAVTTEIWERITDPVERKHHEEWMAAVEAMEPKDMADVVMFVLGCPRHMTIHEIVARPTLQVP